MAREGSGQPELYDLVQDISEAKDLASAMPDKVKELQAQWDAWNVSNVAPLWGGGRIASPSAEQSAPGKKKQRKNQ